MPIHPSNRPAYLSAGLLVRLKAREGYHSRAAEVAIDPATKEEHQKTADLLSAIDEHFRVGPKKRWVPALDATPRPGHK